MVEAGGVTDLAGDKFRTKSVFGGGAHARWAKAGAAARTGGIFATTERGRGNAKRGEVRSPRGVAVEQVLPEGADNSGDAAHPRMASYHMRISGGIGRVRGPRARWSRQAAQ